MRPLGGAAPGAPDPGLATLEEQPGGRATPGRGAAGGALPGSKKWNGDRKPRSLKCIPKYIETI